MNKLIDKIHLILRKNNLTLSVAESCTGGLLSSLLTQNSGSSAFFLLGVVTYSNKAKEQLLSIPHRIIAKKGAVSEETALLMAKQIRKISQSDLSLSITGIAGPLGGTLKKPVGTVFIATASSKRVICQKFLFRGNRNQIRMQAAKESLKLLKATIA